MAVNRASRGESGAVSRNRASRGGEWGRVGESGAVSVNRTSRGESGGEWGRVVLCQ